MICLHLHEIDYAYPSTVEPSWSHKVDRWYQLDAGAYGLTEMASRRATLPSPELILLASPGASNLSDRAFAHSGATSAQKFAHTLPNIRCAPLAQVMDWRGPMLCFQNDPFTLTSALQEAVGFVRSGIRSLWILSVTQHSGKHLARLLDVGLEEKSGNAGFVLVETPSAEHCSTTDTSLFDWFQAPSYDLPLPGGMSLRKAKA